MSDKELVGGRVRAARKLRGMTQRELGDAVGLSNKLICDIEKGIRDVTAREAFRIAAALGVDLTALVEDGDLAAPGLLGGLGCIRPSQAAA